MRYRGKITRWNDEKGFGFIAPAFIAGSLFLAFVAVMATQGRIPFAILWLYLGMSALSLGMYAIDKSAARKGGQRTPENTLHTLSLFGGWPGALFAQQLLRHKLRKTSFRVVFWLTMLMNTAALAYLLSPYGSAYLALLDQMTS